MRRFLHVARHGLATDGLAGFRALLRRGFAGSGRRTVELGCGPAYFAGVFQGEDYVGVDGDSRWTEWTRQHRPGIFVTAPPSATGLPSGRFDQALLYHGLGELPDGPLRERVREGARLVGPSGRVLVLGEVASAGIGGALARAVRMVGRHRPDDWRRRLAIAGVEIERFEAARSGWTDAILAVLRPGPTAGSGPPRRG
jgi:hypothetical protein